LYIHLTRGAPHNYSASADLYSATTRFKTLRVFPALLTDIRTASSQFLADKRRFKFGQMDCEMHRKPILGIREVQFQQSGNSL
jgi:hypothetical protein